MAGRKTLYTEQRVKIIIAALQSGAYERDACLAGGISEDTFANWKRRYSDFAERATRAKSEGWVSDLALIRKAANDGDWRAAAEHLDRTASPYRKSVDINLTVIRERAERIAAEIGVPVDEVMATAEAVASGAWAEWQPSQ